MILPTLHREGSNRRALDVWATLHMVMAEHHFCIWLLVPCHCTALMVGLNITRHIMNCPWAALTIYIPGPPPLCLAVPIGTLYINSLLGRSAVMASYVKDPPADPICMVHAHIGVYNTEHSACCLRALMNDLPQHLEAHLLTPPLLTVPPPPLSLGL